MTNKAVTILLATLFLFAGGTAAPGQPPHTAITGIHANNLSACTHRQASLEQSS